MVGNYNRSACCARKNDGCRFEITMNLLKSKTQSAPRNMGWMSFRFPVVGEVFFLTSPFIERGYRQYKASLQMDGKPTYQALV
jgi:TRAP-type mannitol/chloroaromatic compound transport system permease small subunit